MKDVVIYGATMQARQLKYYIENEKKAYVRCFVVDKGYKKKEFIDGINVIEFDEMLSIYTNDSVEVAISFAYKNMMDNRKDKFFKCKKCGYSCFSFVSDYANVFTSNIEEGTIVYPGATLAANTKIGIGNFFEINSAIAHDTVIGNFNFFAPSATVSGGTVIGNNCFFGIGSVVYNNLSIADYTLIGAGAVISDNTEIASAYKVNKSIKLTKGSKEYL